MVKSEMQVSDEKSTSVRSELSRMVRLLPSEESSDAENEVRLS
jgi:hypothetical protein